MVDRVRTTKWRQPVFLQPAGSTTIAVVQSRAYKSGSGLAPRVSLTTATRTTRATAVKWTGTTSLKVLRNVEKKTPFRSPKISRTPLASFDRFIENKFEKQRVDHEKCAGRDKPRKQKDEANPITYHM